MGICPGGLRCARLGATVREGGESYSYAVVRE